MLANFLDGVWGEGSSSAMPATSWWGLLCCWRSSTTFLFQKDRVARNFLGGRLRGGSSAMPANFLGCLLCCSSLLLLTTNFYSQTHRVLAIFLGGWGGGCRQMFGGASCATGAHLQIFYSQKHQMLAEFLGVEVVVGASCATGAHLQSLFSQKHRTLGNFWAVKGGWRGQVRRCQQIAVRKLRPKIGSNWLKMAQNGWKGKKWLIVPFDPIEPIWANWSSINVLDKLSQLEPSFPIDWVNLSQFR